MSYRSKTEIDDRIDDVRNGEKLHAWMKETEGKIDALDTAYSKDAEYKQITAQDDKVVRKYSHDELLKIGTEIKDLRRKPGEFFGNDFEKTAFGSDPMYSDASPGSSAVAVQYVRDIIRLAAFRSEIYNLCKKVPMTDRTAIYPTDNETGLTYTYRALQANDVTESAPSFSTVTLTSYDFSLYNTFSKAFVEDEIINLAGYLQDRLADAMSDIWDEQIINGNADPFTGILNASTREVTMSGVSFSSLDADDLISMLAEFATVQERQNLNWVVHPTVYDGVIMKLRNANGDFIFRDSNILVRGMPRQLLGMPVAFSNAMPTLSETASATSFIILGDFRYALSGERTPMKIQWLTDTMYAAQNLQDLMVSWFRWAFILGRANSFCKLTTSAS